MKRLLIVLFSAPTFLIGMEKNQKKLMITEVTQFCHYDEQQEEREARHRMMHLLQCMHEVYESCFPKQRRARAKKTTLPNVTTKECGPISQSMHNYLTQFAGSEYIPGSAARFSSHLEKFTSNEYKELPTQVKEKLQALLSLLDQMTQEDSETLF